MIVKSHCFWNDKKVTHETPKITQIIDKNLHAKQVFLNNFVKYIMFGSVLEKNNGLKM
jgi:hypothetical protein